MVNGAPDVFSTSGNLVQFGVRAGLEMPIKVRCCESGAGPSLSGTDRSVFCCYFETQSDVVDPAGLKLAMWP